MPGHTILAPPLRPRIAAPQRMQRPARHPIHKADSHLHHYVNHLASVNAIRLQALEELRPQSVVPSEIQVIALAVRNAA